MGPNTAAGLGAAAAGAVSIVDKGASTGTESPTAAVDSSVAGQRSTLFTLTDSPSALGEVEETSPDSSFFLADFFFPILLFFVFLRRGRAGAGGKKEIISFIFHFWDLCLPYHLHTGGCI